MINIIECYRLQNMEDELERMETKYLNSKNVTRQDLRELEALAMKIALKRLEMSK